MKLYTSRYESKIFGNTNGILSSGALLKWQFEQFQVPGYSLLHPWESYGDLSLDVLMGQLKKRDFSNPLIERAYQLAKKDSEARSQSILLGQSEGPPLYHQIDILDASYIKQLEVLVKSLDRSGLNLLELKIKIGRDPIVELQNIKNMIEQFSQCALRLKLDSNLKFSKNSFESFLSGFSESQLSLIDYVEDAFEGTLEEWQSINDKWNLRLAADFVSSDFREVADVWIVKPTRQDSHQLCEEASHKMKRIVFTSAWDHPFGVAVAKSEAARAYASHPLLIDACGLQSEVSVDRVFSAEAGDTGFGFNKAFDHEKWVEL